MSSNASNNLPHRVATTSVARDGMRELKHPLNPEQIRHTISLGDMCGLTKEGVHFCRADPHTTTSVAHYHQNDDEWYYILETGEEGATLLIQVEGEDTLKEETIHKGDFLGFPAGKRSAHSLRAGSQELVYLVGGTRQPMDVCVYPGDGQRLVADRSRGDGSTNIWYVQEEDVKTFSLP